MKNGKIMRELISALRSSSGLRSKEKLRNLWDLLPQVSEVEGNDVIIGDDAAAIKYQDGYLLLAAEGVYPPLLRSNPYLAGRTSVLTNVNDIYSMGGRPLAIVDVLFETNYEELNQVFRGIRDNAARYRVPLVGGHLTSEAGFSSLSVCILGRAMKLLSSFDARVDDDLVVISSLDGKFNSDFNFWDSSSHLSGEGVLSQLELLPQIAEEGLADTAKDISMAGLIGSILMLLESSGRGADIYIDRIPKPLDIPLKQWLLSFPSFGFILSIRPRNTPSLKERCEKLGLTCASIGKVSEGNNIFFVNDGGETELFWDLETSPFIGINAVKTEQVGNG